MQEFRHFLPDTSNAEQPPVQQAQPTHTPVPQLVRETPPSTRNVQNLPEKAETPTRGRTLGREGRAEKKAQSPSSSFDSEDEMSPDYYESRTKSRRKHTRGRHDENSDEADFEPQEERMSKRSRTQKYQTQLYMLADTQATRGNSRRALYPT